jgi:hypothetical protein
MAVFVGGVIEPAWEYVVDGATFEWAFGATRNTALGAYLAAGMAAYVVTLTLALRQKDSSLNNEPEWNESERE